MCVFCECEVFRNGAPGLRLDKSGSSKLRLRESGKAEADSLSGREEENGSKERGEHLQTTERRKLAFKSRQNTPGIIQKQ